jgi:C-terminal processing protease CtpA/Prc
VPFSIFVRGTVLVLTWLFRFFICLLQVVQDVRGMRVCDLYEGSSSYWSALKIDDIVCAVDGQDIRNGPPSLVLQLTNGSIGTSMCLHVIRKESADEDIAGALTARGETPRMWSI